MTHEEQTVRMRKLTYLMNILNEFPEMMGLKGKALIQGLRAYVHGWAANECYGGKEMDPILWIALLRGGDPRTEIQRSIETIVRDYKIKL